MIPDPNFPQLLACTGQLNPDGQTAEFRVINRDEKPSPPFTVSITHVKWIPAPEISLGKGGNPDEPFSRIFNHPGLALVACRPVTWRRTFWRRTFWRILWRIMKRQPKFVTVRVPAVAGANLITVKPTNIARPRPRS